MGLLDKIKIYILSRFYRYLKKHFIVIEITVSTEYLMYRLSYKLSSHLETLGLLANLHNMLAPKFPLPPLVVLLLIGELRLVLQADQLSPRLLDGVELAELQLLHGFMMPEEHGMFQVLLGLTLV